MMTGKFKMVLWTAWIVLVLCFIFAILASGCGKGQPEVYYGLPAGVTNFKDLGNNWHTFELKIDGVTHKFLYKGYTPSESITEIDKPR